MSTTGYRPALDGVRCIAVLGVLVYHLDRDWLPGGFLGVDVFFVLSGYLITTLLIAERERTGRIALGTFWGRRARRLLPASLAVVACVAVWLAGQDEFVRAQRRGDLLAAVLNVENWRLIAAGESYFEGFAAPSPLRHFWSLAIEEQFYLVWPLSCALLLRFGRRGVGLAAGVVGVASALWMVISYDADDPSRVYYGTDTRVHQLLVGCLLGVAMPRLVGLVRRSGPAANEATVAVGVLSTALLGVSFALLSDDAAFYYRGGSVAVAVVSAGLILSIELQQQGPLARAFGWEPAAAVGRISYGLYVWHWPIFVWMPAGTWSLDAGLPISAARLAVTAAVAIVSYRVLEQPIRRATSSRWTRPRNVAAMSFSAIGLVALLVIGVTWRDEIPAWAGDGRDEMEVVTGDVGDSTPDETLIAIVGDSVAVSLVPGLTEQAVERGWILLDGARRGCPLTSESQAVAGGQALEARNDECATVVPQLHADVVAASPDVVVWHDLQSALDIVDESGRVISAGSAEWTERVLAGWQTLLDQFRAIDASVVVIIPPWRSPRAEGACGDDSFAPRCIELTEQDRNIRTVTTTFLERNANDPDVVALSLDDELCPDGAPCPAEVDGLEPRELGRDRTHFTEAGARWIAPVIADAIEQQLA